eukprot:5223874-Pyramimonas_sp.AAC.1
MCYGTGWGQIGTEVGRSSRRRIDDAGIESVGHTKSRRTTDSSAVRRDPPTHFCSGSVSRSKDEDDIGER